MGYSWANDILQETENLRLSLEMHFAYNCYPPIPQIMLDCAIEAIEACRDDEFYKDIRTPVEHRRFGYWVPAQQIVNALHLEAFI